MPNITNSYGSPVDPPSGTLSIYNIQTVDTDGEILLTCQTTEAAAVTSMYGVKDRAFQTAGPSTGGGTSHTLRFKTAGIKDIDLLATGTSGTDTASTTAGKPQFWIETDPASPDAGAIFWPDAIPRIPFGYNIAAGGGYTGDIWGGWNVGKTWGGQYGNTGFTDDDVLAMKELGINCCRIVMGSHLNEYIWTDTELHRVMKMLTDAEIIVMPSDWPNSTGRDPTPAAITLTKNGYYSMAAKMKAENGDNPYFWINPFNEPGGQFNDPRSVYNIVGPGPTVVTISRAWVDWHVPCIERFREVYPANVVVLDDTHWGQGRTNGGDRPIDPDESACLTYMPELIDGTAPELTVADPVQNLLGSIHLYSRYIRSGSTTSTDETWNDYNNQKFHELVSAAKTRGVAIVAGEIAGTKLTANAGAPEDVHDEAAFGMYRGIEPTHGRGIPSGLGLIWWAGGAPHVKGHCVHNRAVPQWGDNGGGGDDGPPEAVFPWVWAPRKGGDPVAGTLPARFNNMTLIDTGHDHVLYGLEQIEGDPYGLANPANPIPEFYP